MSTRTQTADRKSRRLSLVAVALVVIVAFVSVASYAATQASSSLSITAVSTTSGQVADLQDIGVTFKSTNKKGSKSKGVVITKLNLGDPADSDNFIIQMVWTNVDQVRGVLKSSRAFLKVGLYYLDTDQQKASNEGYSGACGTNTQRKFKEASVDTYVCPDTTEGATKVMSKFLANAVLKSTVANQAAIYVLADIHKPPRRSDHEDDDADEDQPGGGSNPGQVKKLKFNLSLISI